MRDPAVRLRSSARTNVGQVRENNEDNIHLWSRDDFVLAVVADGMGGAAAGEEASRIAVEAIQAGLTLREARNSDFLREMGDETLTQRLRLAIQSANDSIVEKAASSPEFRGMGTTVTMAFVRDSYAILAHVGDSRAYLVDGSDGVISQITSDHSFVEALLAAGHITQEQADEHPMRNVLYRALGQAEEVDVDVYYKQLHSSDRLILCSDGLTRHVKPDEIARVAMSNSNPDVISQGLVDLANARGGEDNVSVIVIIVEENTPGVGTEAEALLADTEDDDETLVLKDRRELHKHSTAPSAAPEGPSASAAAPVQPAFPPEMFPPIAQIQALTESGPADASANLPADTEEDEDAVPIVDEVENEDDTLPTLDLIDQAIATRPNLDLLRRAAYPDEPLRQEGQGEGRDTLMPDQ